MADKYTRGGHTENRVCNTWRVVRVLEDAFGMINSAATLKRAMKKLIEDVDDVDFYWDDILVHTRTWEEHIRVLRELFSRLEQAGLTIRPIAYSE